MVNGKLMCLLSNSGHGYFLGKNAVMVDILRLINKVCKQGL